MDVLVFIIGTIIGIVVWGLYHKLFKVTYYSFKAIATELVICWLVGVYIAGKIFGW